MYISGVNLDFIYQRFYQMFKGGVGMSGSPIGDIIGSFWDNQGSIVGGFSTCSLKCIKLAVILQ